MTLLLNAHKRVMHLVLKDFFNGHILKNFDEVVKACNYLFEQKGISPLDLSNLKQSLIDESLSKFERDPRELQERNYTERSRPENEEDASKAHYTAAERNFVRKILSILRSKTVLNLSKQTDIERVIPVFNELYPKIFGNHPYRSSKAIEALIRREQKRLDYGFKKPHKNLCEDDRKDMKTINNNLKNLVLRRLKLVEDEQPFFVK